MLHSVQLAMAITLLLFSQTNWAAAGKITEQTGPAEIVRNNKSSPSAVNTPVEMQDIISTAKSQAKLTFEDNTTVKINEHSKLVIDDFVYDPNKGTGKLAMKVALGTARYASGQISKNNPQSVNVKTPTASISVRGTDFSMTVDELGRSLVMLLPSCDEKACVTGRIEVSNDAGVVILDVPYQATMVASLTSAPTNPVVVNIDQANITNMLIVSNPVEIKEEIRKAEKNSLDTNLLDVDLLQYKDLDKNYLDDEKSLDINYLNGDLLSFYSEDALSIGNKAMLSNQLDNTILPNYNEATGLKFFFSDDKSKVTVYKLGVHNAFVTVDVTENAMINLDQAGIVVNQMVNKGGTTSINIIQK